MDRNTVWLVAVYSSVAVALRKESVDRNFTMGQRSRRFSVALRKESVDRNTTQAMQTMTQTMSLSARRAWIEI